MTLLDAMKTVLKEQEGQMSAEKIANLINEKGLLISKGGKPLQTWRIMAAARKYRATFRISSDSIRL